MDQKTRPPNESGTTDPYANSQVIGQSILAIVNGMELVQSRALKILAEYGICP